MSGRKPVLTDQALAYARRCNVLLLKARRKFSQRAVAAKLGVSLSLLNKALAGNVRTIEQSTGPAIRPYTARSRHSPIGFRGSDASMPCSLGGFDVEGGSGARRSSYVGE